MPPVRKCRFVFSEPRCRSFFPGEEQETCSAPVVITVEELEAVRLCDLEHLSQCEASGRMGISRGTFQRVLYSARFNIASALVNGREIRIEGGSYRVGGNKRCGCKKYCRALKKLSGAGVENESGGTGKENKR